MSDKHEEQQKGKAMSGGGLHAKEQDKMTGVTIVVIANSMWSNATVTL
jgi:hypothetical protein